MENLEGLFELFSGTPRQGPGSEASTLKALSFIDLPKDADIADIGCGSGAQTLALLKNTSARITAVDIFDGFLARLGAQAQEAGLSGRLNLINGDMAALNFTENAFDCVWSEGAAYIMGFSRALKEWRRLLKPRGFLAVSDLTLTGENRPEEVTAYWTREYSEAAPAAAKLALAESLGYEVLGHFILPKEDWLAYYAGLRESLEPFRRKNAADAAAAALVKETEAEMEFYSKYSDYYSYGFYALRRND